MKLLNIWKTEKPKKTLRTLLIAVISATCISGVLASYSDNFSESSETTNSGYCQPESIFAPKKNPTPELKPQIKEYVPYMFLFHHLANIKDKTSEVKEIQSKSKLPAYDFSKLLTIAAEYQKEVTALDEQARGIIDEFHKQYPPGKMPSGTAPPKPPQELIVLQNQRNDTALKYRDQAKEVLGTSVYTELQTFVDREIMPKISSQKVDVKDLPENLKGDLK